jgi:hypothetical protein
LRLLSCMAPAIPIPPLMTPPNIIAALCGGNEAEVAKGLYALKTLGLLETLPCHETQALPSLVIHPLVAETNRIRLIDESSLNVGTVAVRIMTHAADQLDHGDPQSWSLSTLIAPHLNAVLHSIADLVTNIDLAALARASARVIEALIWHGSFLAGETLGRFALARITRLGAEHDAVLSVRYQLASTLEWRGALVDAEQEFQEVLTSRVAVFGPEDPRTLEARHELAKVQAEKGDLAAAEQGLREVLGVASRVHGPEHPDSLSAGHELGFVLCRRGQALLAEAERQYRQVLNGESRVLGSDHPETLATRYELARLLAEQGELATAEREFGSILRVELRALGPSHPNTLATRAQIARVLLRRVICANLRRNSETCWPRG